MTKLTYSDVADFEYVTSDAGITLSPVQQSLAVQAVSVFRELYNWTDGSSEADNIDALVASTIAALLQTDVPPKDNMNNRILLLPSMGVILTGNAMTKVSPWLYFLQNPATNGSSYKIEDVVLSPGRWRTMVYGEFANNRGILQLQVKNPAGTITYDSDSIDTYNATTGWYKQLMNDFTLTVETTVDLHVICNGKHTSSSNYLLYVAALEFLRI